MSVIIDTFEVVADSQNQQGNGNSEQQAGSASKSPKPVDIEAVFEHQQWRNDRLRAH